MGVEYEYTISGKVQADENQSITSGDADGMTNATTHQISVVPGDATVGTVAVMVKPYGATEFSALNDEFGTPVVIDIEAPKTYVFDGNIDALRFDPVSVDGTYGVAVSGWD